MILVKEIKKVTDSLQIFIGPNMHEDINNITRNIRNIKHNMFLVKYHIKKHIKKQNRINKIKKYKRKIRKSNKK